MPTEISREVQNGAIKVTFDDGSFHLIPFAPPPKEIEVDAALDPEHVGGHVFAEEEAQ